MIASFSSADKGRADLASIVLCGIFAIGLGFAAPPAKAAGGDDDKGASAGSGASGSMEKKAVITHPLAAGINL